MILTFLCLLTRPYSECGVFATWALFSLMAFKHDTVFFKFCVMPPKNVLAKTASTLHEMVGQSNIETTTSSGVGTMTCLILRLYQVRFGNNSTNILFSLKGLCSNGFAS